MKKIALFLSIFLVTFVQVFSQAVKPEDAKIVAQNALTERLNAAGLKTTFVLSDDFYKYPSSSNTSFYIFETLDRPGYVIISAEKSMHPLLAYSFTSSYDENNLPPSFRFMLNGFVGQIEYIRTNKVNASTEITSEWNHYLNVNFNKSTLNIQNQPPLLTTTWNQDCWYNEHCPADPAGPCGFVYAGCVATAMGQIMKFHNWPLQGNGSFSYVHSTYGNLSANFGNTTYDWSAMPNSLTSSNFETARLIYHAAVSVSMGFSPTGSGAFSQTAANSLRNFFRYAPYLSFVEKDNFDNTSWVQMLRNDLLARRPIYYAGRDASNYGHAFIADGFQNNHFRFDFGWGGSMNGYFLLTQVGGFNNNQAAILNVEPHYTGPQYCNSLTTLTNTSGTINDGSAVNTRYANQTSCKWLIQVPNAEYVVLNFTRLNTEPGLDRILVYEGTNENGRLLADISGFTVPTTPIVAAGNSMFIWFVTDDMSAAFGWEANYTSWLTSIDETNKVKLSVAPNPASDYLNLTFENISNENVNLTIFNINGQKVLSESFNVNNNTHKLDISNLSAGVYSLEVKTENTILRREKIVKK